MCDAQILVPNRTRLNYFWTVTTEAYDGFCFLSFFYISFLFLID